MRLSRLLAAIAIALASAVFVYGAYIAVTTGYKIFVALGSMCGNQIAHNAISPDRQHRAVIFERDCGAMDGFSTQVSVLGISEPLEGAGNVFRSSDRKGPRGSWGGPNVRLRWLDGSHLQVVHDPAAEAWTDDSMDNVIIFHVAARLPNQLM